MSSELSITDRMQVLIDGWEAAEDRRAVFLSCYVMMTRSMLAEVARGGFRDAAWVSRLLHRFADYYFEAIEAYDSQPVNCAAVWQFAFDAACAPRTRVIQNLLLGVNAHINYDLVLALVDALHSDWHSLSDGQRQRRYHDHCHVNHIIADTVNSVQDQVIERYSPAMDIVDKLFGPIDEWLIARLIAEWRDEVWTHAGQMLACSGDPAISALRQRIEQHAMTRARAIAGERGFAGVLDLA